MTPLPEQHPMDHDDDDEAIDVDDDSFAMSNTFENEGLADGNDASAEERRNLARTETRRVFVLKTVIFVVLILATIATSVAVFSYARSEEDADFEHEFESHATKVFQSFHGAVYRKLGVLDTFSTSITLFALENNLTFPFVTLPFYELRGQATRALAEGIRLDYMPLVTDALRPVWEEYAQQNQGWLDAAVKQDAELRRRQDERFGIETVEVEPEGNTAAPEPVAATNVNSSMVVVETSALFATGSNNYNDRIYGKFGKMVTKVEEEGAGPFLPIWQVSPATPTKGILNFNLLHSSTGGTLRATLETHKAVLGEALALKDPNDKSGGAWNANFLKTLQRGQYRHMLDDLEGDPSSNFVYPIFDTFSADRSLAGAIRTSIFWRKYFTDILPESSCGGLIAVLSNTHNQTFSYRIEGAKATFLGPGDHHDPRFEDMGLIQDVKKDLKQTSALEKTSFTQADLNTDYCGYTLALYPSQEFQDQFHSTGPIIFSLVVVAVFIVTAAIFITYDFLVEKRQSVVMNRAMASGAIVASLFPEHVKDQLIEEKQTKQSLPISPVAKVVSQASLMTNLTNSTWSASNDESRRSSYCSSADPSMHSSLQGSPLIADLYKEASVLFCDLVGFTAWSSSRKPEEVFQLLEAIFGAFDQAAEKRRVYKIETIGDCYVAATGVPKPQVEHAVILCRFAQECQAILKRVTMQLVETLGEDTANLQARIGIHSGPVTGGVLRANRGQRFQLFGDTMNVTSRCETNGSPGRIQVTQATADLLTARGKSSWLTKREDLVQAKGKGAMQCYWVSPSGPGTVTTLSTYDTSTHEGSAAFGCDRSVASKRDSISL
ncbi:Receptor-type guanylate cyclase gcy [Seminavis robusta]|uniref:Receptor-type guanylate cyclase gcy n=1 Tax=Seminavis robusta TaxID=568900 RepID=A0A9N8HKL2_9STRA|nr:Receptor-type guanylate cyclase gcy [Seminavis robusta]|eukprot:Sro623_g177070.1 Receptor-type guanylate cyclase gcy (834) ;mRNA; f:4636-7667